MPSRRRVLATIATAASVSAVGCSDAVSLGDPEDAAEPIEVAVENATADVAEVAIRVLDREGSTLFNRVLSVDPEHFVSRGAIETTPATVRVFTPAGVSRTWEYAPDLPEDFDCDREDIGMTIRSDTTVEAWYKC